MNKNEKYPDQTTTDFSVFLLHVSVHVDNIAESTVNTFLVHILILIKNELLHIIKISFKNYF